MMTGEAIWAVSEATELVLVDLSAKRICIDFRVAGAITTILGILATVLRCTGQPPLVQARSVRGDLRAGAGHVSGGMDQSLAPSLLGQITGSLIIHSFHFCQARVWPRFLGPLRILLHFGGDFHDSVGTMRSYRYSGVFRFLAIVMFFGVLLSLVGQHRGHVVNFVGRIPRRYGCDDIRGHRGLAFLPALLRYGLLDLTPVAWALVVTGMNDPCAGDRPVAPDCRVESRGAAAGRPALFQDPRCCRRRAR